MYIDNEIHEAELPGILRRLWEIAPYELWESRAEELALQERQNRHFTNYFNERFAIERAVYEIVHQEGKAVGYRALIALLEPSATARLRSRPRWCASTIDFLTVVGNAFAEASFTASRAPMASSR